uniref:Putative rna-directed dna polymerase from mobile element jockey n=1 Tax=Xenopsylla cheopis TaxID=163159 RepID=A0A6M2DRL9_XENCH
MLVSETHFTCNSFIKIPEYSIYSTQHPDGRAHGGSAVIIKSKIKHFLAEPFCEDFLQATNVCVNCRTYNIIVSAIYCPPKHTICKENFDIFFQKLGNRFITGGDFNAKHTYWGSRLTTTRGRELHKAIKSNNLTPLSTGEPSYWPSDPLKIPDLLDFFILKNINSQSTTIESNLDLSSDHSPVILTYSDKIFQSNTGAHSLVNKLTNWELYRNYINENISCNLSLKSEDDINKAVDLLTSTLQQAASIATPSLDYQSKLFCPIQIKKEIAKKRKLRKIWQITRSPEDKKIFNNACKNLKYLLDNYKNEEIKNYLNNLSATKDTNYSLWKAVRNIKKPITPILPIKRPDGSWARSYSEKANTFANHLSQIVYQAGPRKCNSEDEDFIYNMLHNTSTASKSTIEPIKRFSLKEVTRQIKFLKSGKSPGPDQINSTMIKNLPEKAVRYITILFNSIIRLETYPQKWKLAKIILIPKPGKDPYELSSYRPISLLSSVSKLFERLLLNRINLIINQKKSIPNHQFGFRNEHSTTQQIHRVVNIINDSFQNKKYCSAVFLDINQAFDKVWHSGLLYKLKTILHGPIFRVLQSYLSNRQFMVDINNTRSSIQNIHSGVPQGGVLSPTLFLIYTSDLPQSNNTYLASFADDICILAKHDNPKTASDILQSHINKLEKWFQLWRFNINTSKSYHITFTLRTQTCPPITINNIPLPEVTTVKYLGMHLDRRLTWKYHIQQKKNSIK